MNGYKDDTNSVLHLLRCINGDKMKHKIKSFINTLKGIKQHIWKLASFDNNIKTLIHKTNQLNSVNKEIDDFKRRLERIEQCIYVLSIKDDVKAIDTEDFVKDMAHQMYGEHQARQSVDEDITTDDVPF